MKIMLHVAALMLLAGSAQAQDLPTDQLSQHADVVRQNVLRDKTVFRNRPNIGKGRSYNENKRIHAGSDPELKARARATCRNKGQLAAKRGHDDARVQQLYALCRQAGY